MLISPNPEKSTPPGQFATIIGYILGVTLLAAIVIPVIVGLIVFVRWAL